MTARTQGWHGAHWIRDQKRLAIYHRDGFACVYCGHGAEAAGDHDGYELSLDHVVACELGGTNDATNLVTACERCNYQKRHLTIRQWLAFLRDQGGSTAGLAARVRRQTRRPLDLAEGQRLLRLRQQQAETAP